MESTDERLRQAVGPTVAIHDPKFAGTREAVDFTTPAREAVVNEGERLRLRVERLSGNLERLREAGAGQISCDRVERDLDGAVAELVEFLTVADGPEPAAAVADVVTPGMGQEGYISIADLLRRDLDSGEELADEEMELRLATLRAFNLFAFQDGIANVWLAFKNWLAVVRRTNPELLDGISKADLALLLGETRAATCDREIRIVEKFLQSAGVRGFQLLGGNKGMATRKKCREAALGNQCRRGGKKYLDRRAATESGARAAG